MAARKKAARKKAAAKAARKSSRKTTARKARGKSMPPRAKAPGAEAPVFPEVEALVELMHRHQLYELDYRSAPDGSREIRIARGARGGVMPAAGAAAPLTPMAASETPAAPVAPGEDLHAFKSPMVGTFYRAPNPEASAFVSVGDRVDEQATVCIIEAMKVMNEIAPDVAGEIVSIEVENGEAVEFGQTLFLIRPN